MSRQITFSTALGLVLCFLIEAFSCIGTGYSCDKGGIEIHLPVDVEKLSLLYNEAKKEITYGQEWSGSYKKIFFLPEKGILLYAADDKIRFQIAVKNFSVQEGLKEECTFWVEPKMIDPKQLVKKELERMLESKALHIEKWEIEEIAKLSSWGIAGNQWIEISPKIEKRGIKSCGGENVAILKDLSYWESNYWLREIFLLLFYLFLPLAMTSI